MSDLSAYSDDDAPPSSKGISVPEITVQDSEGSVDESIIVTRKKIRNRARVLSDSDEEPYEERYTLSPRTRKSITGNFRRMSSEDEASSEIDYSDNENTRSLRKSYKSKTDHSVDTNQSDLTDSVVNSSINETENSFNEIGESSKSQSEKSEEDSELIADSSQSASGSDDSNETLPETSKGGKESIVNETTSKLNYSDSKKLHSVRKSRITKPDRTANENLFDETAKSSRVKQGSNSKNTMKEASENLLTLMSHNSSNDSTEANKSISSATFHSATSEIDKIPPPPRYTMHFEAEINEELSSTICETSKRFEKKNVSESNSSDDIQVVSVKHQTIEISSSDDDLKIVPNLQEKKSTEFLQPTIGKAFSKMPPPEQKKTPKKAVIQYVSKSFYEKEVQKLADLKLDLIHAQKLEEKISSSLPDGGRQLRARCDTLRNDIAIKSKYISNLVIETVDATEKKVVEEIPELDWDDLSKAVSDVKPTHTGKKGLATFNTQKVLTMDRLKDLHGSLETCPTENEIADDPKGLKIKLMRHQGHALKWMMWREKQKPRGGILADDMGLGKTLSMISLVLADKNERVNEKENSESDDDDDEEDEEVRTSSWKSKGRRTHYNGGTLVVCPASLIRQWEHEVSQRVSRNSFTVCVHHGNNRTTAAKHLRTYDLVVTTYNIVTREQKSEGAIFGLKWRRIILDEAHVIRNHKAQMSMSVCALRSKRRWVLTGTPIQNKEMDVYSLLKFLRCSPFNDLSHWKRWIDNKSSGGQERLNAIMKTLMLRRTKAILQERGELNCLPSKEITVIEVELDKDEMNVYQKVMVYSKTLFAQFLFQRAERNSDLMYAVDANRPTFLQTKDPNGAYYELHKKFTRMHQGKNEVKSTDILVLLLRLRQICCHPGLIDAMLDDEDSAELSVNSNDTHNQIDILEQLNKLAISENPNRGNSSNNSGQEQQLEETAISRASAKVMQRSNPVFNLQRPSSKILKVMEILRKNVLSTNDKAIVVSQWCSVLNIIKSYLARENIATLTIDGSVNVAIRQDIINEFNDENSSKKVMLLSLTAGGVGLNLIGANHLLLTDLHWNPQLESQAQDRIYRVGQKKSVTIYKFMCKNTVEERIKVLQDHKLALANNVLSGVKNAKGTKLTIDELKGLFGL